MVVAKIDWHRGELFPRIGFVVTSSRLSAGKVIKVYNGRRDEENRIKEGKNTLRWDKTSCQPFEANQARLKMGGFGLQPLTHDPAVLCLGGRSAAVHGLADQAINQSGRQGFLSCPEVVCPCGLRLSFGSPLPINAGLGSLNSTAVRYLGSKGVVCKGIRGKLFFRRNLWYHAADKRIRLQEQKL
jgi:hypothetical protein